ncbi:LOW QUALITY PROTEIN: E3 ubiquitin-protein ligase ZNF598 [Aphomia sociella]
MADSQANDNSTCVVCFKNVLYYSIGECDHPVCFECSTRMRVLCLQNECPICRQVLLKVVFTATIEPYKELHYRTFTERLFERQFKIGFCSQDIKNAYDMLLENRCKHCDKLPPFRTFSMLSDHMRKVHERYFCDLCVKHLRIFTSERKCYTRQELAHHRRKGDLDDTSHRGHPLCEFCEERFMDADELYRHLRKEHLYCHLCDADGRNLYYASHPALAHHFRTDHYLCEEGDCAGEHLTAVFRSEIDLKAHRATVHGRGLARGAARQARTLELQFNIAPHPAAHRPGRDGREARERAGQSSPAAAPPPRIDTRSDEQFPRLSAAPSHPNLVLGPAVRHYKTVDGLTRNDKNFPALDGNGGGAVGAGATSSSTPRSSASSSVAATVLRNSKPSLSIQLHSQPTSASNFRLTQTSGNRISIPAQKKPLASLSDDDFPSLGISRDDHPSIGAGTVQPSKVTLINSQEMNVLKNSNSNPQPKKQHLHSEAFPALSSTTAPSAPPQWITVSKSKEKLKPSKPESPPQPREPTFNPVADFPTLPVNNSKSKSKKPQPQPSPAPAPAPVQSDIAKLTKKEKKKLNSIIKKEPLIEIPHINGVDKKIAREMAYVGISVNNNDQSHTVDRKVKAVDSTSTVDSDKKRNGGNGDFALAPKDYPHIRRGKTANGSVPPGFKARPACNGMTFTNSSGQTFSAPVHAYIPPGDFERRNRALVKKFAVARGAAAVEDFKVASRAFRDGIINADEFYQHCRSALGSQLDEVFPELVALLPDIAKQQELVLGRGGDLLHTCAACGQLLANSDRGPHEAAHWPPLASR